MSYSNNATFRIIIYLFFISYPLVTVLHLESSENNFSELAFSISKKRVSTVKPSQAGEFFFARFEIFFEILAPFHISKHS